MTKLYLVWNEAKTQCIGFKYKPWANYAVSGGKNWDDKTMVFTAIGDRWIDVHGDEKCTITEIEV